MEKKNSKWSLIWILILIFGSQFLITHNDRPILPEQHVEKIVELPAAGPVPGGQSPYVHIKKMVIERNPWDYVVLYGLLFVIVIAYWKSLSYVIDSPGLRLLLFVIGLPIGYFLLFYASFIYGFGR